MKLSKHKLQKKRKVIATNQLETIYKTILERYQRQEINGVSVIPSAFPFDELYNQRTINLAKYLSKKNHVSLFVVWQWTTEEVIESAFKEVYHNVFVIPMYAFFDSLYLLKSIAEIKQKYAIFNIPSTQYNNITADLRSNNFTIIYDIMDEWEEFFKVGQASWYSRREEERLILAADIITAVSRPLIDKFNFLRNDIVLIGNGYDKELLGPAYISRNGTANDNVIHVGYFGHLTESWFDWELVFKILENKSIILHIIGYGANKETLIRLKKFQNANYHGKVQPSLLRDYVKNWNVGIIPFKDSSLSQAVDPIKIYEYLYYGLPTVVTGID
ncbi:glycosyltransferase, partial [Cohnella sp. JJ-181]|uniref:glycosyltransferase n=1 Tax=Cohnella rhizoplanae TaxID=2974897 RepID=UPI00232F3224